MSLPSDVWTRVCKNLYIFKLRVKNLGSVKCLRSETSLPSLATGNAFCFVRLFFKKTNQSVMIQP